MRLLLELPATPFCCSHTAQTSTPLTSWRKLSHAGAHEECRWQTAELPDEVARGLHTLMSELGLLFGAVDLICTPSGEHVFLKVNPAGEFFWLERHPGLSVSEAIADVLLGRAHRRQTAARLS